MLEGAGHVGLRQEQLAAPGALPAPLVLGNPRNGYIITPHGRGFIGFIPQEGVIMLPEGP